MMFRTKLNRFKATVISGAMAAMSVVSAMAPAVTPSMTASAADTDNYAKLLQYSLYFYDANMCGNNSSNGLSWRGNCHMDDEVPGGFHDAGDHAMFGLPQGFSASTLGWAYYEFPDAFDSTGQTEHLKMITDHFCDFFKRSTKLSGDTVTNFLYQKGDGTADHSYWGPPESQGKREMFWTSNGASEIAAEYAAALAANYKNFGNKEDLDYAKALYKFSKANNQTASNQFYGSNSVADDQAWAAGWLYIATGDSSYLNDSKNFPEVGWVHGWNDTHLGAACLYGENSKDWSAANGFISSKASGSGYMFLDKWGSARLNCSMQFTALVAAKHGAGNYTDWAKGQMNYILGQNPANTCFVTGFASNSAKNAHHRAASGYTSYEQFNMNGWDPDGNHMSPFCEYGPDSHKLIGALVGGPCDAGGSYHDNMADYICNEVAIDYNAGLVGAAAGLYHFYKTGSIDTSIEGVTKIYSGSSSGGTTSTTTTTVTTSNGGGNTTSTTSNGGGNTTTTTVTTGGGSSSGDTVLMPTDMKVGTEKGDDGGINNYAEFSPKGAKSATLYLKVNSNDTEVSGAFGTWTGEWEQEDFKGVKVGSDKTVAIDYTIPAKVGSTVKAMVFWPHGDDVTIEKVVLHSGSSSGNTTTSGGNNSTTTTTSRTTVTTTSGGSSGDDTVLMPTDMKVGTEKGDDGGINNYAEFSPKGAKSATLYLKVNSNDTEVSGAFGTWTGEWEQEDFKGVKVGSDKTVAIDYTIPAKVGSTIKAMVFWPHGDDVTIEKVVLHGGSSAGTTSTTTTTRTTTSTTTTTTTTTTITTSGGGSQKPVTLAGDANCDNEVNMADAVYIMQVIANPDKYGEGKQPDGITSQGVANGDVDGEPGLTNKDALCIQQYKLGIIDRFPIQ